MLGGHYFCLLCTSVRPGSKQANDKLCSRAWWITLKFATLFLYIFFVRSLYSNKISLLHTYKKMLLLHKYPDNPATNITHYNLRKYVR